jgi:hypothetical protein
MELRDALRNSSQSKLFLDTDKDPLGRAANELDEVMREAYKVSYMPRKSQFNELIKVSKPGISEVFTGALKKFHDSNRTVGADDDEEPVESKNDNIDNTDKNR